jgi:beta-lysine 5,6-aminomutase alpha subunit
MKNSKLDIDFNKIIEAKAIASAIANEVQQFANQYTTITVERALCRFMGIDGVSTSEVPLPNIVVDQIQDAGLLGTGLLYFLGNAMLEINLSPQQIADKMAQDGLDITKLHIHSDEEIREAVAPFIETTLQKK